MIEDLLYDFGATALTIGLIIAVAFFLIRSRFLSDTLNNAMVDRRMRTGSVEEAMRLETITTAVSRLLDTLVAAIATIMILNELGVDTTAIIASAGLIGVALGFGATELVRDYLNGALLIIEDQLRVGDFVTCGGVSGTVEEVNLRYTSVRDLDGTLHFVPNGQIRIASNHTRDVGGILIDLQIGYDANIDEVIRIINRVGEGLAEDPEWAERIVVTPTFVRITDFRESSMNARIMGQTLVQENWAVMGELRRRLKDAFDAAGITFPLPQRVVHQADHLQGDIIGEGRA